MKIDIKSITILLSVIIIFSCGDSDEKLRVEKNNKERVEKENFDKKQIKNIIKNYDAVYNWDTTNIYTYLFQENYIEKGRNLCFFGSIIDIIKEDSIYIIKVDIHLSYLSWFNDCIAHIKISKDDLSKLDNNLSAIKYFSNGFFVIKGKNFVTTLDDNQYILYSDFIYFYSTELDDLK